MGSIEREEPQNISFSIAAGTAENGWFDGPREQGTFSRFGVPLYDALQGTGARLPYKAAWSMSVEWPLRLILNWQIYVLARVFLSSFVYLWLTTETIRSWAPTIKLRSLLFLSVLLLSPSFPFLRWTDWTVVWSQTAATAGLAMFLTRRHLYEPSAQGGRGLFDSWPQALAVFVCLSHLATGHPGVFPNSLFILVPLVVTNSIFSHSFRLRLLKSFSSDWRRLLTTLLPALFVVATLIWELRSESRGQGNWTVARRIAAGGFFPDQIFVGVSRGHLPESIERLGSVFFCNAFGPLAPIMGAVLPTTDSLLRASGSITFGTFTGLTIALAGLLVSHRIARTSLRYFTLGVSSAQIIAVLLCWAAIENRLPLELTPSASYITFSMLLPLNLVFCSVILSLRTDLPRPLKPVSKLNITQATIYLLIQLGLIFPNLQPSFTNETRRLVSVAESRAFSSGFRSAMATFEPRGDESSLNVGGSYGLLVAGRSFVQSSAQLRDTNYMQSHTPTAGGYDILRLQGRSPNATRELLKFLQIETVVTPSDDVTRQFISRMGRRSATTQTIDSSSISLGGMELTTWKHVVSYSDVVINGSLHNQKVCPILEELCPIIYESYRANYSDTPKLSICNDPCLWKYTAGTITADDTLVVPVGYDSTLTVTDSVGAQLPTLNVSGFLGVSGPLSKFDSTLRISVSPDKRMYLLVGTAYVMVAVLVILIALSIRKPLSSQSTSGSSTSATS